jgi:uncharacterized protein (TIGR03663 family)
MTRAVAVGLVVLAVATGLLLRVTRLDARPMHHDEANQAMKFGTLLETGVYRYDPADHHGPALYYLSLPSAWLRGQHTFAALDERTLRFVPAAFGAAMIVVVVLFTRGLGRTAVVAGASLLAVSPAMVFYSRMFIQESLFACFALTFVVALGRMVTDDDGWWSVIAGAAAGLALATKETSAIVIPAAIAAVVVAARSLEAESRNEMCSSRRLLRGTLVALAIAVSVAAVFYSSFLASPRGLAGPLQAVTAYTSRAIAPADHVHPSHYYLGLLAYSSSGGLRWSEGAVLLLALVGLGVAWNPPGYPTTTRIFWIRYVALYTVFATTAFSLIPYKTPWNLLPFYIGVLVLGGVGTASLAAIARGPALRGALAVGFALVCVHLGWQAWRASVIYSSDDRNPYVYAQTLPDTVRMAGRIRALAARHPDGTRMQVSVIAPPDEQWPLPWYLRTMPNVGYWTVPGDPLALKAPVIVSSLDHAGDLEAVLGNRYVSEFYGLRPKVLLALYVERPLWNRFISGAASGSIWHDTTHSLQTAAVTSAARETTP